MSDAHMARTGPHRPAQGRRRGHRPTSLEGLPTAEDLAQQPHEGEERDRFSLWTPEQVEEETRNVRLDVSFEDVVKIRDQCEMIAECMRTIIGKTREHRLGSLQQRIEARREMDSLRRTLARFNGQRPRTNTSKVR